MGTGSDAQTTARCRQVEAASQRFSEHAAERAEVDRLRARRNTAVVDAPDQIEARAERLRATGEVPARTTVESLRALERIIDEANELQAVNFLTRGVRAADTVARISLCHNGREMPLGTGSLVSPQLLLTNNHVLPSAERAAAVVVEFRAEAGIDNTQAAPVRLRPAPADFFVTDAGLDYTLVRVAPGPDGRAPGAVFGWNPLIADQGKIVIGEAMNVIGHPMGRLKEISIRSNRLDLQLDDFLHYSSDTEPGSSGSPVFNDQWELVALHHSGVAATDSDGHPLRTDGKRWQPGDGEDAVHWIANEGARVSALLRDLRGRAFDAAQRALLDELGPAASLSTGAETPATREALPIPGRGIRAATGAFAGRRTVVFLHGRGQQGRDPAELRRGWAAGLNKGLTLAGLRPVDPADITFPFYGDQLAGSIGRERLADAETPLYADLVAEAARRVGMPETGATPVDPVADEAFADVLSLARTGLSWVAAHSGLDSLLIRAIFRDVAAYLEDEAVRRGVLDAVRADLPARGELILVAHSLGTVVALDLLTELPPEVEVSLLATAGSPLGLDAVQQRLLAGGPKRPERVGEWINTFYGGDPIAIGCPLQRAWGGDLRDLPVQNPKERAHDIAEYLAHPAVATAIGSKLSR
ncbi:trypsin-like serine peptidase [Nocardia harenae]|uniref:trypsin-like serine peptidase n=1 Tax=Nocardia harenae TaxID=358707 RepID=UPI00082B2F2D|nr:serine protease [Nocardia harenae]